MLAHFLLFMLALLARATDLPPTTLSTQTGYPSPSAEAFDLVHNDTDITANETDSLPDYMSRSTDFAPWMELIDDYKESYFKRNGQLAKRWSDLGPAETKGPWQYNGEECYWVDQWLPTTSVSCTEYCDASVANTPQARLRYHIVMQANGQDPVAWCNMFKARMKYNCQAPEPDFFDCNYGQAPENPGLRTWALDGWRRETSQHIGVNLRFDFAGSWPSDAGHACVSKSINESTCAFTYQLFGTRCLPVLWQADYYAPLQDETPVPPQDCLYNSQVPLDSQ
ncbi:hypothetical protein F5Y16DRAFT_403659 [Xylariaceae sp. FL0255]|nr:hypothetical protein F5Y16DRAFT_403659 [Xylariaceae sp. FL0255]